MDAGGDVSPPKKGLSLLSAVVQPHFELEHGSAGAQADAVHSFHSRHGIVVAAPYGDGAVWVAFHGGFDRHEGCGTMVLRPVELDATGDPGASEPHEGGLNDVLTIEEV